MENNIKLLSVLTKLNFTLLTTLGRNLESLGIQPTAYAMLAHLVQTGPTKTQKLGEIALITSGTITHTVNKLLKAEYVVKYSDEDDRRVHWVAITEKGRRYFEEVHAQHIQYVSALLGEFSDEEKAAFIEQIKYFGIKIEKKKEDVRL